MNLSNREFNWLIILAFRDALGRRLIAPSIMVDFIKRNHDEIEVATKKLIIDEVNYSYKNGLLGGKYEVDKWLSLKKELENEDQGIY